MYLPTRIIIIILQVVCSPETKYQLIEIMGTVQDSVADKCVSYYDRFRRQTHVTPKSYLSFLEGYKVLYKEKHINIADMAKRFVMLSLFCPYSWKLNRY